MGGRRAKHDTGLEGTGGNGRDEGGSLMGLLDTIKSLFGLGGDARTSDDEVGVTVERDTRDEAAPRTGSEDAVKAPADDVSDAEAGEAEEAEEAVAASTDAAASTGSLVDAEDGAAEPAEAVDVGDNGGETEVDTEPPETEEAAAAGTDAAASTGSLVDEKVADEAAEPAEAVDAAVDAMEEVGDTPTPAALSFGGTSATSRGDSGIGSMSDAGVSGTDADDATDSDESRDEEGGSESPEVLKGIGPAYARRLADAGIDTVAELAAADAEEVAEAIDVSEKRVSRWITRAGEH